MFARLRRARLLAVAGCLTATTAATAVDATPAPVPLAAAPVYAGPAVGCPSCGCDGPCGPVGPVLGGITGLGAAGDGIGLFARNPRWWHRRHRIDGQNQPACAVNNYPLSDWAYIRKYCGPTLIPGTCYGHFQTKWRKWEDHCPTGAVGCDPAALPVQAAPYYAPPVTPAAQPPAVAMPQPMTAPPAGESKKDPPKADAPDEPKKPKSADLGTQLPLPDVPTPGALPPLPVLETRR